MKGRDRQVFREKRRDNWLGTPVPTFGTGTKNLNRETFFKILGAIICWTVFHAPLKRITFYKVLSCVWNCFMGNYTF